MTIEVASFIGQLDPTYPTDEDFKYEGDDHIRLTKSCARASFPSVTGAVTATHTQLNYVLRAVLTPAGEAQLTLPTIAARGSKLAMFDASGAFDTSRTLTAFDADVSSTAANAATASGAAGTATTQAGIATGAAAQSIAARDLSMQWSTSLAIVSGGLYGSRYYAMAASGFADASSASAGQAQGSATAAAASAAQAGATLTATSTTALTAALSPQTLTVQANKAFAPGQYINVALASNPAVVMRGPITSYAPSTGVLQFTPDTVQGAGTAGASWLVSVGAAGDMSVSLPATVGKPSFMRDFRNGHALGAGDVFTRAGAAVRTNRQIKAETLTANRPRFQFDDTGNSLGLLLEMQGQNLLQFPADTSQTSAWVRGPNIGYVGSILAPRGLTSQRWQANGAGNVFLSQTVTLSSTTAVHTYRSLARIVTSGAGGAVGYGLLQWLNSSNAVISSVNLPSPANDGAWAETATELTPPAGAVKATVYAPCVDVANGAVFDISYVNFGTGGGSAILGASPATRPAEAYTVPVVPPVGEEGRTYLFDFVPQQGGTYPKYYTCLDDGSDGNSISLFQNAASTGLELRVISGSAQTVSAGPYALPVAGVTRHVFAMSFGPAGLAMVGSIGGAPIAPVTSTQATPRLAANTLRLSGSPAYPGGNAIHRRALAWSRALTQAEMTALIAL